MFVHFNFIALKKLNKYENIVLVEHPPPLWLRFRCVRLLAAAPVATAELSPRRPRSESKFSPLLKAEVRDLLVSSAAASHTFFRRYEAEREEATAVRRADYSGSSFPPQCRAVVFVPGPSVRQLA